MKCNTCGGDFEPRDELKRLMAAGAVDQVCERCEVVPEPGAFFKRQVIFSKRHVGSVLCRVDLFNSKGIVTRWMSLLPMKKRKAGRIKKGTWRHEHTPFVMTEHGEQRANHSTLTLTNNLDTYSKQGRALKFVKIPGSVDAMTGVDTIEIALDQIDSIEDDSGLEINVQLKDGGRLRLQYRN